jgi:hypothetical protein
MPKVCLRQMWVRFRRGFLNKCSLKHVLELCSLAYDNRRGWWSMSITPAALEAEIRGSQSQARSCKTTKPSQKQTKTKRASNVAQVVELLPSRHEPLSSIPSTAKQKSWKPRIVSESLQLWQEDTKNTWLLMYTLCCVATKPERVWVSIYLGLALVLAPQQLGCSS